MNAFCGLATRARVEGLVILAVALFYLWEAHNVPEFYQLPGVPGPTTFPYLLGVVFAACGAWLLVSPRDLVAHLKGEGPAGASEQRAAASASDLFGRMFAHWHLIAMWIVILAYLWFMPDIGFLLTTFLLLTAFVYLLGETRWLVVLGLALMTTVVIYTAFKYGLNVRLPLGVLELLAK